MLPESVNVILPADTAFMDKIQYFFFRIRLFGSVSAETDLISLLERGTCSLFPILCQIMNSGAGIVSEISTDS